MAKGVDPEVRDVKQWLEEHRPKKGGKGRRRGGGKFDDLLRQAKQRQLAERAMRASILYEQFAGGKAGPNVIPWSDATQHLGLTDEDLAPGRPPIGIGVGDLEPAIREHIMGRLPPEVMLGLMKKWKGGQ